MRPSFVCLFTFIIVFVYGCAGSSLLFSSCGESRGYSRAAVRGLLSAADALVAEHGL